MVRACRSAGTRPRRTTDPNVRAAGQSGPIEKEMRSVVQAGIYTSKY
jgi:hypothetical protein